MTGPQLDSGGVLEQPSQEPFYLPIGQEVAIVEAAYRRLLAGEQDAKTRQDLVNRSFECLQALDVLDDRDRFPLRFLYRGLLNDTLFRRTSEESYRQSALKAYKRYLESQLGLPAPDTENIALAKRRLDEMERASKGD